LGESELQTAVDAVCADSVQGGDVAATVLLAAALQVHFTRLAAALDAASLQPVADGVCPACGAPPVASAVVDMPRAH
ncbi:formate dehydrogenase accessory protein FdhE domain-containing protein, partial [Vibrio parahaemolyticus]